MKLAMSSKDTCPAFRTKDEGCERKHGYHLSALHGEQGILLNEGNKMKRTLREKGDYVREFADV